MAHPPAAFFASRPVILSLDTKSALAHNAAVSCFYLLGREIIIIKLEVLLAIFVRSYTYTTHGPLTLTARRQPLKKKCLKL